MYIQQNACTCGKCRKLLGVHVTMHFIAKLTRRIIMLKAPAIHSQRITLNTCESRLSQNTRGIVENTCTSVTEHAPTTTHTMLAGPKCNVIESTSQSLTFGWVEDTSGLKATNHTPHGLTELLEGTSLTEVVATSCTK